MSLRVWPWNGHYEGTRRLNFGCAVDFPLMHRPRARSGGYSRYVRAAVGLPT